jgi:hypothetical protein
MFDFSGSMWFSMTVIGVLALGVLLAWGGYQTWLRRSRTGEPIDARQASPREAAMAGGERRSSTTYLTRLGIPVAAVCVLLIVVIALYT